MSCYQQRRTVLKEMQQTDAAYVADKINIKQHYTTVIHSLPTSSN